METASAAFSLRHTLASLAYRASRALENAPPAFANFKIDNDPRTPLSVLAHMGDLMDWSVSILGGKEKWHNAEPLPWADEVARFFGGLQAFDSALVATTIPAETANRLFQGPIADAISHVGQLAMLRRMAGCAIAGENYFVADVVAGRVGIQQAQPHRTF